MTQKQENQNIHNKNQQNTNNQKDTQTKAQHQNQNSDQEQCQEYIDAIKELESKLNELNDRYLRLAAEYDNYRKRTTKEKAELIKTAGEKVLVDLLPVVDDFERALEHIESAEDIEALKEGIFLIYNRFQDFLKKQGIEEIAAEGESYDPNLHEAIQQVPAQSEEQKGKIVKVIQKGYKLNDKIIRHAKVIVAM